MVSRDTKQRETLRCLDHQQHQVQTRIMIKGMELLLAECRKGGCSVQGKKINENTWRTAKVTLMIYGKQNESPITASESHMALTGDGRLRQCDRTHRLVQFGRKDRNQLAVSHSIPDSAFPQRIERVKHRMMGRAKVGQG
jgi:hypothetical protein